jgi:hypothetical protein
MFGENPTGYGAKGFETLNQTISNITDAATQQKLVRAGLAVAGAGAGAAGFTLIPHTVLASFLEGAATLGAVSKGQLITNLLDTVATNPRLLRSMATVTKGAKFGLQAAGAVAKAQPVLGHDFGKRVRVNGQTGTVLGTHPESGKPFVEWDK